MGGFLYGAALQFKLDIRSRTMLITSYVVPLLFFGIMGGIFTAIMPESKGTLIQSMTVFGVTIGAVIGLPPSLVEVYGSDIRKVYRANGVPLYLGVVTMVLSAFIHLMIMGSIIFVVAPVAFDAVLPENIPLYFVKLAVFILVSLSIGSILGLMVKNQAKLTMVSQVVFLPSIMLSGIMFSADLLPGILKSVGSILPATYGYKLFLSSGMDSGSLLALVVILSGAVILCGLILKGMERL